MNPRRTNIRFFKHVFIVVFIFSIFTHQAQASIVNSEEKTWLNRNSADITFAPEKDFPPMIWNRYDTLFGISHDYFNFMQQLIDVRFKTLPARPLNEILTNMRAVGEKSIVSSLTLTPQRLEFLIFTRPYFSSPAIFIANNNKQLTGNDIQQHNYSVAVGHGFGVHDYLSERYPKMKLVPLDNDYLVVKSVLDKQTDIGVLDVASLSYLLKENDWSGINKVGDTGFVYDFAFAVPKNMPELRNILDEALQAVPQSFHDSVLEKWNVDYKGMERLLGESATPVNTSSVDIVWWLLGLTVLILGGNFVAQRYFFKKEEEKINDIIKK